MGPFVVLLDFGVSGLGLVPVALALLQASAGCGVNGADQPQSNPDRCFAKGEVTVGVWRPDVGVGSTGAGWLVSLGLFTFPPWAGGVVRQRSVVPWCPGADGGAQPGGGARAK